MHGNLVGTNCEQGQPIHVPVHARAGVHAADPAVSDKALSAWLELQPGQ